jgi:high-affinity iron transporter
MSPATEGWLALVAAALVISCTVHIFRHGKTFAGEIRAQVDRAAEANGRAAWWAVFAFVALMIGREGVETATMLASLATAGDLRHLFVGAIIGVALAAALAVAWARYGRRVDLSLFFRVTAVFMVLFAVQLVVYAVHEFTEVGLLPLVDNEAWHVASEPFGPDGQYGAWLSYGLVLLPLGFLAAGLMRRRAVQPAGA